MIRQLVIILGCLAVGELIVHSTSVTLPSSIIGMLLLTLLLKIGWIKESWVRGISDFLVKTLPFYFVPAGVALMMYFELIATSLWAIVISAFGSTIIVLIVTGWVHQYLRNLGKKNKSKTASN
ncbi:MAG: CidA/LrgA family protein [Paludibacteraceae bacterium]